MRPIHLLAAALFAAGGLALSTPVEAAPKAAASVSAQSGDIVLVGHRDRDRDWRRKRGRDDEGWRRDRDRDWDRDRDRRHRHGKWDHDRGKHHGWDRGRGHDRDWRRGRGHDRDWSRGRGHDRDWSRGRGHDRDWAKERRKWAKERRKWAKERHKEWSRERRHWNAWQHPRHPRWVGRPFRHDRYSVIREPDRYRLPPPWRGQFYAQSGNEIFLVDEATRMILDAFVFSNAFRR